MLWDTQVTIKFIIMIVIWIWIHKLKWFLHSAYTWGLNTSVSCIYVSLSIELQYMYTSVYTYVQILLGHSYVTLLYIYLVCSNNLPTISIPQALIKRWRLRGGWEPWSGRLQLHDVKRKHSQIEIEVALNCAHHKIISYCICT